MPRTSADYDTRTRAARLRLTPRNDPYFRNAGGGFLLGYKRLNADTNGVWIVRTREAGKYKQRAIGEADDHSNANGASVLDFATAMRLASDPNAKRKAASSGFTVADALKAYFDTHKSPHREEYRRIALLHIVPTLGGYDVNKITRDIIDKWLMSLVDAPRDKKGRVKQFDPKDKDARRARMDTANRILTHLKAALNRAFDIPANNIVSDAAWRRVESFQGVSKARKDHGIRDREVSQLIASAASFRPPLANLIQAGYLTGARLGELRDANVGDFDARGGILNVDGKTKARPITLTDDTTAFIAKLAKGKRSDAILFPDQNGKRWPGDIEFGRQFAKAAKLAGLPYSDPDEGKKGGVTFYTLRHAYISRALESGKVDISVIAENCGTSVRMIEQHYKHILAARRKAMLESGAPSLSVIEGGKASPRSIGKRKAA